MEPLEWVREDRLLEHKDWRDTGCSLAPSCLSCPFERCRYDAPSSSHPVHSNEQRAEVLRLHAEGLPAKEIATQLRMNRGSVYRLLSGADTRTPRRTVHGSVYDYRAMIHDLRAEGLSVEAIMRRLGFSRRQVTQLLDE